MSFHSLAGYQTGFPDWVPVLRAGKGAVCSRRGSYRIVSLSLPFAILPPFKNWVLAFLDRDCPKMKMADLTGENRRENLRAIAASFFLTRGNFPMASNTMPFTDKMSVTSTSRSAQDPHESIVSGDFLFFSHFPNLATAQESLENHASKDFSAIFTPCHSLTFFAVLFYPFFGAKVLQLSFFDSDARSDYFLFKVAILSCGIFSRKFLFQKSDFRKLLNLFIYTLYAIMILFNLAFFEFLSGNIKSYIFY